MGDRHHCQQCPDYDLCDQCRQLPVVSLDQGHETSHEFTKIAMPWIMQRPSETEDEWTGRTADACRERYYTHDAYGFHCKLNRSWDEATPPVPEDQTPQPQAENRRRQGPYDKIITEAIRIRDEKTPATLTDMVVNLITKTLTMWSQSACCRIMEARLDQHEPEGGWKLRKGVLLALGTISDFNEDYETGECGIPNPTRIMIQIAIFLRMAEYVHERTGTMPELFAQDPLFGAAESEVLWACGIKILATPQAQTTIDSSTFVFAPCWSWGLGYEIFGAPIENQAGLLLAGKHDSLMKNSADFLHISDSDRAASLHIFGSEAYTFAVYADYSQGKDAREVQRCYRRFLDARDSYEKFPLCDNDKTCMFSHSTEIGKQLQLPNFWMHVRKPEQEKGLARCHFLTWNSRSPWTIRKFDIVRSGSGYGLVGDIWYGNHDKIEYGNDGDWRVGQRRFVYWSFGFKYPKGLERSKSKLNSQKEEHKLNSQQEKHTMVDPRHKMVEKLTSEDWYYF